MSELGSGQSNHQEPFIFELVDGQKMVLLVGPANGELPYYIEPADLSDLEAAGFKLVDTSCRVYWGSHGCRFERGHEGPHECECARDENGNLLPREEEDGTLNVGAAPFYGPGTNFYGEDAT